MHIVLCVTFFEIKKNYDTLTKNTFYVSREMVAKQMSQYNENTRLKESLLL